MFVLFAFITVSTIKPITFNISTENKLKSNNTFSVLLFSQRFILLPSYSNNVLVALLFASRCHCNTQPGVAALAAFILDEGGRLLRFSFFVTDFVTGAPEEVSSLALSLADPCWGGASHLVTGSLARTGLLPRILSISFRM